MRALRPPPSFEDVLRAVAEQPQRVLKLSAHVSATPLNDYLHWEKLKHLAPPAGLTREDWWLAVKWARIGLRRELPFVDESGRPFWMASPDLVNRLLHDVDRRASAQALEEQEGEHGRERKRYLVSAIMDEAITSSQLEGASTTRSVAKEMLRSGRAPRDPSEHMILRNYHAMEHVRETRDQALSPERIAELHAVLAPDERVRTDADRVRVVANATADVLFVPAPAATIESSLVELCAFANRKEEDGYFLHPVLRAVILHFWLSYVHPFTDGNGRTARALFYWSMLHQGYHLAEFLALSRVLRRAPVQYARAFLHVESDDNDVTYFLVHQLRALVKALDELFDYVRRKIAETTDMRTLLRQRQHEFNHRQIALLAHALRNEDAAYTIEAHMRSHGTVYQTARQDLLDLAKRRLLTKTKVKKAFVFRPADDLGQRLERVGR